MKVIAKVRETGYHYWQKEHVTEGMSKSTFQAGKKNKK
jgi:hypothetical protein